MPAAGSISSLLEVAIVFLKLGTVGFGGPAAHISLMHDEVVRRRKWLNDAQFLDLLGATNLIPGPNSTEMAIHIGYLRAGWLGLLVGGICFILPAMLIVLTIAWGYMEFGKSPVVGWLLYGIKPIVISIILAALIDLGKKVLKDLTALVVCLAVIVLYVSGTNELLLLVVGGVAVFLLKNYRQFQVSGQGFYLLPLMSFAAPLQAAVAAPFSIIVLFMTFLKIGAVLYGSGYVLFAYLHADFVTRLGWLTDQQLIDAIAIGQFTPGPLFTTATFIGYLFAGVPGAVLATIGIFLPAFVFVAVSNPLIPKIRQSPQMSTLLDGIIVASLALMAVVTWQLGKSTFVDVFTALIALVAFALLVRFRMNSTWLILSGALIGILRTMLA